MKYLNKTQLKKELSADKPLYLFDDDPDGLCSFLQLYRHIKGGKGIIVKRTPRITEDFVRKVEEYGPDKIFVLDIVMIDQEFIDKVKTPIVWIDHHEPQERENIMYYNPRVKEKSNNIPTSKLCYDVIKKDLWIGMAGTVADWFFPADTAKKFSEKYPKLLPKNIKNPGDALFNTELGKLIKIIAFNLKGKTRDVMKSIKILTRIDDPYEILEQKTPRGKLIYKRFDKINKKYKELLSRILDTESDGEFLVYTYYEKDMSMTKEISNEVLYKRSDKVVVIGRVKSGEVKMSIRSKNYILPGALKKALQGIEGFGGGHEHACGAVVKEEDFEQFIKNLKRELA